MLKKIAVTAGLLAFGTSVALAQSSAPTPAPAPSASAGDMKDMKEWQVAKTAKVTLPQAISTAETHGDEKGGRAIDADFEKADSKNPVHYAVKVVYPSGKLVEYGINAETGAVYKTENQPIERYFTFLTPKNFNEAKTSLKDALAIAEQKAGGGKAYEAEVSKDGKAVQYEIKVAGADKEQTVKVGPDGKVID
ncbi:PepSY domain-containing protein [Methylobacterium sp. J-076]|uniref:PepSY domain-containing protein n=1 Tax=Methylobacterium sp. J-076 TaxID=2836655 RepID=UPI001FBAB3FB|nr:PepSY domain-containing protein [Methylobacterium sp. J-076]MCJ2015433.1 PepSY domain-containing protein [Methylobacterium sp. J-076]